MTLRIKAEIALCSLMVVGLLSMPGAAGASVTIGQTPLSTPAATCNTQLDLVQPSVTSATRYVVPSTISQGTITQWSHRAAAGSGQQITFKVFRPMGGTTYQVIGHDGPRDLKPSSLNTFSTSIPVQAGDVIGENSANAATVPNGCLFAANGDSHLERAGDLGDGATGTFASLPNTRVNASAKVEPVNAFSFPSVATNRRGFAIVTLSVPNPGRLSVSGNGVGSSVHGTINLATPGTVGVAVWATGFNRFKLKRKRRVVVVPTFRYTPTSGARRSQSLPVLLRLKHRKHHRHR
jgi:hypothetical protein